LRSIAGSPGLAGLAGSAAGIANFLFLVFIVLGLMILISYGRRSPGLNPIQFQVLPLANPGLIAGVAGSCTSPWPATMVQPACLLAY